MASPRRAPKASAKPKPASRDHPTIAAVRAVRAAMLREAGGSLSELAAMADREAAAIVRRPAARRAGKRSKPRRAA
jgi:hypothetical protein